MGEKISHCREDISDLIIPRVDSGKILIPGLSHAGSHRILPENFRGADGSIPRIHVVGDNLPEAWENALIALYFAGGDLRTEYDRKNNAGDFVDPPSIDCSMSMTILDPLAEPRFHRCFPGGPSDLEEYRQEVLQGVKDWLIRDSNNPEDKRWEYTYHQRLFLYDVPGLEKPIDQIDKAIELLAKSPISRRVEAITWQPWVDLGIGDPACLQRFWFRMKENSEGQWCLNTNMNFRSRDAYKAAFMNCDAFVELISHVANGISELRGEPIKVAAFQDTSDSFHIYGQDFGRQETGGGFETMFLRQLRGRNFEERTWTSDFIQPMMEEARSGIAEKIIKMKINYIGQHVKSHGSENSMRKKADEVAAKTGLPPERLPELYQELKING